MRRNLALLSLVAGLSLLILSYYSGFEIAPPGFLPDIRQVLLLTPTGFMQNYVTDPDQVWQHVYSVPSVRDVNILDLKILITYLLLAASSGTALWLLRRR